MDDELRALPNIGAVLAEQLRGIGVHTRAELEAVGSVAAACRLAEGGRVDCHNMLMALEGAIRGIRWHGIPKPERQALKARFDAAREAPA